MVIYLIFKEDKDSLIGMKRYLRIEHEDENNNLLVYLQRQCGSLNQV
jgi:hypothetical protein